MQSKRFLAVILLIAGIQLSAQKKYEPNWESIDSRPVPSWFTEAKFGIFIHWGVYSVPAWGPVGKDIPVYMKYAEWYWARMNESNPYGKMFLDYHKKIYGDKFQYQDFANDFKAENFNPEDWADLLTASGAKYVVLTSKHHEGFALWPSAESWNWNSVDIGPHRDLAGDLGKAVKAKGLYMGYYYSLYEWFNPLYKTDLNRYVDEHMLPQMKDLITRYQPDILWGDGEWEHPSSAWKTPQFLTWLFNESLVKENIVINDRWGSDTRVKHGGVYTTEYDLVFEENTKEKKITHPWEECRGIGGSFGYNHAENLEDYATSQQLIHMLVEKVARGGNLLLDIGPTADGRIPVIMQQRLLDMGEWLKINGDAIYQTTAWTKAPPVTNNTTLFFTQKRKDLYVISTRFPENEIAIENISTTKNVILLGYNGKIKTTLKNNKLIIKPPVITPATNPCNYAWVFKIENAL